MRNYHYRKCSDHIVFLSILCTILFLCSCGKKEKISKSPINVEVEKIKYLKFQKKIRVQGNIEPKEYADICVRLDGVLENILVDEGDKVKKGAMLFQCDKFNLVNEVEVVKQNVNVAKTGEKKAFIQLEIEKVKLEKGEIDFKRAKKLIDSKVISKDSFERVELYWKKAKADLKRAEAHLEYSQAVVEQAQSNVKIAQKELEDSMIKSPIDGVVTFVVKELGEYAKKGDCVLRIEKTENLEISILLSSNYYSMIETGKSKAAIYNLSGDKLTETIISYCSPSIDPTSRTFEIKIDLPKNKKLVSGMLCSIDLIFIEKNAYGVPTESIMKRSGNRSIIFLAKQGKADALEITCGISDNNYTEIKNLADKNISVIVKGQSFLDAGTSIKIVNEKMMEQNNVSQ